MELLYERKTEYPLGGVFERTPGGSFMSTYPAGRFDRSNLNYDFRF